MVYILIFIGVELVRRIIVGIDPGTTAAVGIVSLKGKIISVKSKREFKKKEIIEYILSKGSPTIIATDKSSPPKFVEKIASNFGAVLYCPEKDLSQEDKRKITKGEELEDSHQKDALASALDAFLCYQDTLKKINKRMNELGLRRYKEKIKDLVIKEEVNNIAEGIDFLFSKERKPEKKKEPKKEKEEKPDVKKLKDKIKRSEKTIDILKKYSNNLEEKIKKLEREKRKPKIIKKRTSTAKERSLKGKIKEKSKKIKELRRTIKDLRRIKKILKEGKIPIKVAKETTCEELERLDKKFGIRGDIVCFKKYKPIPKNFLKKLKDKKIEIIVGDFPKSVKEKLEKDFTIIGKDKIKIKGNLGKISRKKLKKIQKKGFKNWLKKYKERFNE